MKGGSGSNVSLPVCKNKIKSVCKQGPRKDTARATQVVSDSGAADAAKGGLSH